MCTGRRLLRALSISGFSLEYQLSYSLNVCLSWHDPAKVRVPSVWIAWVLLLLVLLLYFSKFYDHTWSFPSLAEFNYINKLNVGRYYNSVLRRMKWPFRISPAKLVLLNFDVNVRGWLTMNSCVHLGNDWGSRMTCSTKSLLSSIDFELGCKRTDYQDFKLVCMSLVVCMWVFQPLYKKKLYWWCFLYMGLKANQLLCLPPSVFSLLIMTISVRCGTLMR